MSIRLSKKESLQAFLYSIFTFLKNILMVITALTGKPSVHNKLFTVRHFCLFIITLSNPDALIRKAAGNWCPLGVRLDGTLLHCSTSAYSDLAFANS